MSLKHGLLGFLDSNGPMTGYDLNRLFMTTFGFIWTAQRSQIYSELKTMEKLGYVTANTIIQTGKPNKIEYTITEEGLVELKKWLIGFNFEDHFQRKNAFLMKIFFSGINELSETINQLKSFKKESIRLLGLLNVECETLNYFSKKGMMENHLYFGAVNDFQKDYLKMCINWADKTIAKLEESKNKNSKK